MAEKSPSSADGEFDFETVPGENHNNERTKSSKSARSKSGKSRQSRSDSHEEITPDLTDPNALLEMLESVNLTEEETEDLLKDAYALNKRLRSQLAKQNIPAPLSRSQTIGVTSLQRSSRSGANLPPISPGTSSSGIYGARLNRRVVNTNPVTYSRHSATSNRSSSDTAGGSHRHRTRATSPGKSSGVKRPQWNDRFSFD